MTPPLCSFTMCDKLAAVCRECRYVRIGPKMVHIGPQMKRAKLNWNLICKTSIFVPFGVNLTHFGPKVWPLWKTPVNKQLHLIRSEIQVPCRAVTNPVDACRASCCWERSYKFHVELLHSISQELCQIINILELNSIHVVEIWDDLKCNW